MVLREHDDPLNQSKGIMGPLENATGVQNNRGRLRQRFDLLRKLGQGTYGKVQLGIDKETGQEVAIKTIKKSKIETEADLIRIRREIQIMSSVRHPNIIHIYEVFENREKMVLVMEYAAGGELYDYLNEKKVLKEDEARRIFRQIASAVYYCHKNKICHRDLKLENILLDEHTNAKIADFGLSNVFDNVHLLKTFCGSPLYASPEIVKGIQYCGPEVDCWSLGVLLYTLVYGAMPFDGSNFKRLVKQISSGDYYEPKKTAEASSLIKLMLTVDPLKRATIKDVCSSPWINDGFDQKCLTIAEELANATPVRLDILLSLSSPINTANVVIEKQGESGVPTAEPSKLKPDGKSKSKTKRENGTVEEKPVMPQPAKLKTPNEVKKKQTVKKKSKSSPLLELIVDVEEERDTDEDGVDTLSEISEIQTIAEGENDFKDKTIKPKSKVSSTNIKLPEVEKKEIAPPPSLKSLTPADATPGKTEKQNQVKKESSANAEDSKIAEVDAVPTTKIVQKKKTSKPIEGTQDKSVKVLDGAASHPKTNSIKEVEQKPVEVGQLQSTEMQIEEKQVAEKPEVTSSPELQKSVAPKESLVKPEKTTMVDEPKIPTSEDVLANCTKVDNEISPPLELPTSDKKAAKLKQRSDSTNSENTSPTRIERRNSKVISQKTAELIQNLETKTSTPQDNGKGKKLVFPSLKVSDAKSRFESSYESPGKGAQIKMVTPKQNAQSEKKLSPFESKPKAKPKSVSPAPDKSTQLPTTIQTEAIGNAVSTVVKAEPEKQIESSVSPVLPKEKEKTPALPIIVSKQQSEKSNDKNVEDTPCANKSDIRDEHLKLKPVNATAEKLQVRSKSPRKVESGTVNIPDSATPTTSVGTVDSKFAAPKDVKSDPKTVTIEKAEISSTQDQNIPLAATPQNSVQSIETPTKDVLSKPAIQRGSVFANASDSKTGQHAPKEKLLVKLPPQNKEQAAKKIGSVIQKIVSPEVLDNNMQIIKTLPGAQNNADVKPAAFRTEIQKFVMSPDDASQTPTKTQRSEVIFPVAAAGSQERIIPIKLVDEFSNGPTSSGNTSKSNTPRSSIHKMDSGKSSAMSFSRQNSSDTESSVSTAAPKHDMLKKSPREFIIPIKMESSGQTVTPKDDVLNSESSVTEDNFRLDSRLRSGRFGRQKRYNRLLSDSSVEDDPESISVSASTSRRSSASTASHARSLSQGDEPQTPGTPSSLPKGFRPKSSIPLDRSDSCSSAEDEEDAFEVLTAESLFTSLLDRVRNLTKRLNRESSAGPGWVSGSESPGLGLWGNSSPLQEFMSRAPSEARSFMSPVPGSSRTARSYSREPSVTVTVTARPGWRQSLSREMSGDSDSVCSEAHSLSGSQNQGRSFSSFRTMKDSPEGNNLQSLRSQVNSRYQSPLTFNHSNLSSESRSPISSATLSTYSSPNRPSYGRTLSNMDYTTHTTTLPFRRPIRTYDRSYTGRDTTSTNSHPFNFSTLNSFSTSADPYKGSTVEMASPRIENTFSKPETLPISYHRFNRTTSTPGPDERFAHAADANRKAPIGKPGPAESTGDWVVGLTKPGAVKLTTTQEKMNNYQNYYYNLNKHPTRRFDVLNPAANPNLSRPSTMYETSFVDNNNASSDLDKNQMFEAKVLARETTYPSPTSQDYSSSKNAFGNSFEGNSLNVESQNSNINNFTPQAASNASELNTRKPLLTDSCYNGQALTAGTSLIGYPDSSMQARKRLPELGAKQVRPFSIPGFKEKDSPVPNVQPQSGIPIPAVSPEQIDSPDEPNSPLYFARPLSPNSEFNFVRAETIRLMSPPPVEDPRSQQPVPILKRDVRATSVEKITRFLERKSKPREIPTPTPEVKPNPPSQTEGEILNGNDGRLSQSPEKQLKSPNASKISKPKFIQSLEKKWEKFTCKPEDPTPREREPDGLEESVTSPNESILLQRAISPDKKSKSKFGATTVNFMLGKFKKMEENTVKNTIGKPPIGTGVGRRIQSPYAGARSDSVLVRQTETSTSPGTKENIIVKSEMCPGKSSGNDKTESDLKFGPEWESKQVEVDPPDKSHYNPNNAPRRPLSLGMFSSASRSTSFIPRINREKSQENNIGLIIPDCSSDVFNNNEGNMDDCRLTPNSVSDSVDSTLSEKTETSPKPSGMDDEESVGDRIFRKSFYSRFNSLDRKKTPSPSATANRNNSTLRSATISGSPVPLTTMEPGPSRSPRINKYNPNPLFKELITDEFKSDSVKKNDYTRRVTSKLSKLLREIDSDVRASKDNSEAPNDCNHFSISVLPSDQYQKSTSYGQS